MEAIHIIYQTQIESVSLEKAAFHAIPEKSQRLEEFNANQTAAANALNTLIKETWINAITGESSHIDDNRL